MAIYYQYWFCHLRINLTGEIPIQVKRRSKRSESFQVKQERSKFQEKGASEVGFDRAMMTLIRPVT
jgi:hypothetical protein